MAEHAAGFDNAASRLGDVVTVKRTRTLYETLDPKYNEELIFDYRWWTVEEQRRHRKAKHKETVLAKQAAAIASTTAKAITTPGGSVTIPHGAQPPASPTALLKPVT